MSSPLLLQQSPACLVRQFTNLGSSVPYTENDINTRKSMITTNRTRLVGWSYKIYRLHLTGHHGCPRYDIKQSEVPALELWGMRSTFSFTNLGSSVPYTENDINTRKSMITTNRTRGVMVKAMNCGIVVREFVLQSRYYVHFRANTLGKGMNPLILPPAMGK